MFSPVYRPGASSRWTAIDAPICGGHRQIADVGFKGDNERFGNCRASIGNCDQIVHSPQPYRSTIGRQVEI